ncbi:hypothetical protein ACFX2I_038818 [Malus domestica]
MRRDPDEDDANVSEKYSANGEDGAPCLREREGWKIRATVRDQLILQLRGCCCRSWCFLRRRRKLQIESGVSLRKDQAAFIGVLRRQVQALTSLVLRPHRKVPPSGQFRGNHCSHPVNSITLWAEFNDICSNNITLQVVEYVESVVE